VEDHSYPLAVLTHWESIAYLTLLLFLLLSRDLAGKSLIDREECHGCICSQKYHDLFATMDEDSKLRKRERRKEKKERTYARPYMVRVRPCTAREGPCGSRGSNLISLW
jgi:hypothetical protein